MPKLWLKFKNETGEEKRVEVDRTPFVVGRHSGCDLSVPDSRLSREHIRFEWQTDKWLASDLGSSNGTTHNGMELTDAAAVEDGDTLKLGGGLIVSIEMEGGKPGGDAGPEPPEASGPEVPAETPDAAVAPAASIPAAAAVPAGGSSGIPASFFIIAPLLGIFVLTAVIGAIFLFGGEKKSVTADADDVEFDADQDDGPEADTDPKNTPVPDRSATPDVSGTQAGDGTIPTSSPVADPIDRPASGESGETVKIEQNGAAFVRQIAQNDPRAFLTGEQAAKVAAKVKQIGRSPALAENISSARKNAAAIKALAVQKNLKPQFLAVAAIAKLGGNRGDVLQAAQGVADVYDRLAIHIGNENYDDALLMVAAYDQGAAGETMKMRNMLQELAKNSGAGAREIRSIWFLEKNGKITPAEYERALNFLAIGTIAQNPKEFGVNTEALRL